MNNAIWDKINEDRGPMWRLQHVYEFDPISSHIEADEILCEILRLAGLDAVAKAFEVSKSRCGFYYGPGD